jgi:hypothetical protein
VHLLMLGFAFALGMAGARRLGASARSVFWVALVCLTLAPWGWQVRAQSLAYPLFAGVLWLLAADSRAPSRRVFLAVPLLALWANVHGSVVVGAALVVLRGLTLLPRRRLRAAALLASPVVLLLSPYGFSLAGYYRATIGNPLFAQVVQEWQPTTFSRASFFVVAAFASLWLLARYGRRLRLFEQGALVLSLALGVVAIRNVVWFELAALVLVPLLVDEVWPRRLTAPRPSAVGKVLGVASAAALVVVPAVFVSLPGRWFESKWPGGAATAVARVTRDDPSVRVFADERYADWLLWRDPRLAGRVAYDVRFELLSRSQLMQIVRYHDRVGRSWAKPTRGFRLLVLDRESGALVRALESEQGAKPLYRDRQIVVLLRPRPSDRQLTSG